MSPAFDGCPPPPKASNSMLQPSSICVGSRESIQLICPGNANMMLDLPRAPVAIPAMNPWETNALAHNFPRTVSLAPADKRHKRPVQTFRPGQDSVIYPGLYAPSGIDVMTVLFCVFARPNPKVELGPVDCSVALTVCNLDLPGNPIIYANDVFSKLTGYTVKEIVATGLDGQHSTALQRLEEAVASRSEIQLHITNYKKNGSNFNNFMTLIPIRIPGDETQYAAGFHVATD